MKHLYGEFSNNQIKFISEKYRKKIYFLLLLVDPETNYQFVNYNIDKAFTEVLNTLSGLNKILFEPPELVTTISLIQKALDDYHDFGFIYNVRKCLFDAGKEIVKIKEGDSNGF